MLTWLKCFHAHSCVWPTSQNCASEDQIYLTLLSLKHFIRLVESLILDDLMQSNRMTGLLIILQMARSHSLFISFFFLNVQIWTVLQSKLNPKPLNVLLQVHF